MLDFSHKHTQSMATSREGYVFDPTSRKWKISREYTLNLEWVDELLETTLVESFLKVLAHYTEKYSSGYTSAQCWKFKHFVNHYLENNQKQLFSISSEALIGYRSTLDREHEYYMGALKGFLKTWIEFGYPGVDESVGDLLDNWR